MVYKYSYQVCRPPAGISPLGHIKKVGACKLRSSTAIPVAVALVLALLMTAGIITPVRGGTTGIISGTITDSETGQKLAGVNVIVEGTDLTTVTDENGYYVITNVPPGDYAVTASLIGYSDVRMEKVSVLMDVVASVGFEMATAVAEEEEVIVTEAKPMIQRDVVPTMYVMDHTQEPMVRNQPNLLYQTPGIVATQPGVVADEGGYPHIRGGRANQVGYLLDGILITEPVTNGFGTNIVTVGMDKMEIFTGGYRPEYGNAISGVFNQLVKTGRTAPGASLEFLGGSESLRGNYSQLGGVTEKGLDYYVGAFLWHSGLEGLQFNEVDCSDTIGKFNYPAGRKDKLTLLVGNGSAKYQFPSVHTQTYGPDGLQAISPERDHNHQSHVFTALTWNHTISPSSFFTLRPYYFRSRNKVDAISDDIGFWWETESGTTGLQFDYTNQISAQHLLKAGAVRMAGDNKYWVTVPIYATLYGADYEYTADTDTVQTGLYVQDQMRLSPRWGAEAGLRYDRMHYDKVANPDTSESQLSPRLGLSYAVDPRTNLRCSYGKMIQFVYTQAVERNYTDPMWSFYYPNADLKPETCTQYDLGWERQVSDDYSLQVTPFYRKFKDLLQTTYLDPSNPETSLVIFDNLGGGTSKGIELLVKKRASNNWSGWLSYTYSSAKAESSSDREFITPGVSHYVDWDQRHTAVVVLNYMKNGWTHSLMAEYGSGLPYNLDDGDPDTPAETPNSRRVASHVVVNLNVAREVKGGWLPQGEMRLSIANLFNTGAALDRGPDGQPTARMPGRFVSLGYTRHF